MTLRHSFAVHALDHGTDETVLQTVLGHRHLETTTKYGAYSPAARRRRYPAATPLRESLATLWTTMSTIRTPAPPASSPTRSPGTALRTAVHYFYRTLKTRFFRLCGLPLRC
jgi:hypothetical protein